MQTYAFVGKWIITCIYGAIHKDEKRVRWEAIQQMTTAYLFPWVLMGDLNPTFSNSEKQGGLNAFNNKHSYVT